MGLYPTFFGELVLGVGNNLLAASGYATTQTIFKAHPSNTGVLYVKNTTTTGPGFPLNPGETLTLTRPDLHDYTISGVAAQRLSWAAFKS